MRRIEAGVALETWGRHVAARAALRELVLALGRERVMPVKGVETARLLYDDVVERPIADLDVRVRPEHLEEVVAAAASRGWVVERHAALYANVVLEIGGVGVDVEAAVGPPELCAITVDGLFARSEIADYGGGLVCRVPELHDHALLLALNAFKDKLSLTSAGCHEDLLRVSRARAFDPHRFAAVAREGRVVTPAWIVADWLAAASPGWRAVRGILGPRAPRPLYVRAYKSLISRAPMSLPARLVARAGSDAPARRASALRKALLWQVDVWRGGAAWRRR